MPLLYNDAVQWTVVRVPAVAAVAQSPCCTVAGDVGGGTTPPSSSSAAHANTIIWCVILLSAFHYPWSVECSIFAVFVGDIVTGNCSLVDQVVKLQFREVGATGE